MQNNIKQLRGLDIDDLIVLQMLGNGIQPCFIAKRLGITPAAISHRLRKYDETWEDFSTRPDPDNKNKSRVYGPKARQVFELADKALAVLAEDPDVIDDNTHLTTAS